MSVEKESSPYFSVPRVSVDILVIGDENSGKNELLCSFTDIPEITREYSKNNKEYQIELFRKECFPLGKRFFDIYMYKVNNKYIDWISISSQKFGFFYEKVDGVLFCHAIDVASSLENLNETLIPKTKAFVGDVPTILVGNYSERRSTLPDSLIVSRERELQTKEDHNLSGCVECSFKDDNSVSGAFEMVVQLNLKNPKFRERLLRREWEEVSDWFDGCRH
ncbi:hypothetical protein NPIL_406681 [Nephila pilipes]|uniref:Uncharacterized protein n=1 Tax=Nephila pilipes TaxID=299642 RepID=A0A8X6T4X7_NEPPI|nr:hypothetical protein NPIL_406681 [Nephila pilipes]